MASGHRKRKADLVRANVLNPAGYTNVAEADRGILTNQNNLVNIAIYSKAGNSPIFTAGSTNLLSDAISNADNAWGYAGLTGETTNAGAFVTTTLAGAVGILSSGTKHYYFPAAGTQTNLSSSGVSGPIIIYSIDGPQSSYIPYYQGGTLQTASIKFGPQITGSSSNNATHVVVYVGGQLSSGDKIRLVTANDSTIYSGRFMTSSNTSASPLFSSVATASAEQLAASSNRKAFLIPTGNILTGEGMIVEFVSAAKTSTTPVAGVFIAISSGTYGTAP